MLSEDLSLLAAATALPAREIAWSGVTAGLVRSPPGVSRMLGRAHQLGFNLTPLDAHWASVDGAAPRRFPVRPGMGWVVPGGCEGFGEWTRPCVWINVDLAPELVRRALPEGLDPDRLRFRPAIEAVDPVLARLGVALHDGADPDDPVDRLYREALAAALAAHFVRRYSNAADLVRGRAPRVDDARLARAAAFILDNPAGADLSLAALAATAGMGTHHFARAFARAFGAPPHRFVLERRLDRAEHLPRTTRLPIAEVAVRAGFADASHLAVRLRERRGRSPRAVRAGR